MAEVVLYDTTLRDGAQMEGISYSVEDRLKIARKLDELGVHYIEGGYPGSNPREAEFFARAQGLHLQNATLCAFGSTRRANISAEEDTNLRALLDARTKVVTIVGKSWDLHVTRVLETTLEENLRMIVDSVRFLTTQGRRVFFDAEHFFDGFFKGDREYALQTLRAAAEAGAECVVLCDTNGGTITSQVTEAVRRAKETVAIPLGIHVHNDCELAVANSLAALEAGVVQVQGTINGYGERCGNANLCSIIPLLKLKMGINCVSDEQLSRITEVAHYVSEIANLSPSAHQPFVGSSAFTHKAGLHVSALAKVEESYQHVPPEVVGNSKRVLVSDISGRANILQKARELGIALPSGSPQVTAVLEQVKALESRGFQYEGAEASFELLLRRSQEGYQPPFELVDFLVLVEKRRRPPTSDGEELLSEATVKVRVGSQVRHTVSEGNGPVNALDNALRQALSESYPRVGTVELTDYKVRILDEASGTASQVRVLIESTDGEQRWHTVGSSTNLIEASWLALADSLEYAILRGSSGGEKGRQTQDS